MRSAVSPWVSKEVREFKELGRSDRIIAIIIAGEPNAANPTKARDGILRDEECFCQELRFGAIREDGSPKRLFRQLKCVKKRFNHENFQGKEAIFRGHDEAIWNLLQPYSI